jgi:hypothetical protein
MVEVPTNDVIAFNMCMHNESKRIVGILITM